MAYKKKVNGHKRSQDAGDRSRKRRERYQNALAKIPVPRNVKRYVADKLDERSPDNRFAFHFPEIIRPQIDLSTAYRFYPFGVDFSSRFVKMEHKRMSSVSGVNPYSSYLGKLPGDHQLWNDHENNHDMTYKIGRYNHWAEVLGRGIHMKSSSIYGTIYIDDTFVGGGRPTHDPGNEHNDHRRALFDRGELKLHMFVLEDKKVNKEAFLEWYHTMLSNDHDVDGENWRLEGPAAYVDSYKPTGRPYIAGSNSHRRAYVNGVASENTWHTCDQHTGGPAEILLPNGNEVTAIPNIGHIHLDDFLVDWRKFYVPSADNPEHGLFYNEPDITTGWDGTRDKCRLPVNKARYIVHEHKVFSKSNFKNGACDFSYSFPDHWVNYDKQIMDMPFVYNSPEHNSGNDSAGLHHDYVLSHKQPFVVWVYSHNGYLTGTPDIDAAQRNRLTNEANKDPFLIDMNFKCHYENPIATAKTPSIRQSQPHIYKREPHSMDNPRQMHIDDSEGLDRAYHTDDGTYRRGDTLYIAGSGARGSKDGLFGDMISQWHLIAEGRPQDLRRTAQARNAMNSDIHTVVGHSMGASVAEYFATRNSNLSARLYGAPRRSDEGDSERIHGRIRSYRHANDPISALDHDAEVDFYNEDNLIPFLGDHAYTGYGHTAGDTIYEHLPDLYELIEIFG